MATSLTAHSANNGPIETLETAPADEWREVGSLAAVGATTIWTNPYARQAELMEISLQAGAVGVTVQITKNERPWSPVWNLAANQGVVDPGFIINPGDRIGLTLGGAVTVAWMIRYRLRAA